MKYEFIIVGGGSAGCLMAARLSKFSDKQVLLIESGCRDTNPWIHIPATFFKVNRGSREMVRYQGEPQKELAGKGFLLPQGNVLGGGSSVNAMIYIRGQAEDYDDWAKMGCRNWSYQDMLPVFRDLEQNDTFENKYHGKQGELGVSSPNHRHPLCEKFIEACEEVGLTRTSDFNGKKQEGVGFFQTTTLKGRRSSSAKAFLAPARRRKNLTVMTNTSVSRVVITNGRATGVELANGERLDASGEVILTAGTLVTPSIMMRSGLGPGQHLQDHGIAVEQDLSGVGLNLQDHAAVPIEARLKNPISLFGHDKGLRGVQHMIKYLLTRKGLLSSNILECGGFVDTSGTGRPDIQFHFMPAFSLNTSGEHESGHGIGFSACVLRPQSRGRIRLRSSDSGKGIELSPNIMSAQADYLTMVRGIQLGLKILKTNTMKSVVKARTMPKEDILSEKMLEDHIAKTAKTVYHPVGTCKMGPFEDTHAVVDHQLRVHGIDGLRIADASVMPTIISGNTNATTMVIAERASRFITGVRMR